MLEYEKYSTNLRRKNEFSEALFVYKLFTANVDLKFFRRAKRMFTHLSGPVFWDEIEEADENAIDIDLFLQRFVLNPLTAFYFEYYNSTKETDAILKECQNQLCKKLFATIDKKPGAKVCSTNCGKSKSRNKKTSTK